MWPGGFVGRAVRVEREEGADGAGGGGGGWIHRYSLERRVGEVLGASLAVMDLGRVRAQLGHEED